MAGTLFLITFLSFFLSFEREQEEGQREREREGGGERERERERERENESQSGSMLSVQNPMQGSNSRTSEIMT